MLKVYGIEGRTTAVIRIPAGDGSAWLNCEFRRGRIGTQAYNRPATYSTSDFTEQNIIEDSPYFGRQIKLVRVYDNSGQEADINAVSDNSASGAINYPDVQTKEEAIAFLKAHGAKATNLNSDANIKKYMAKIGVAFPNLEF